MKDIIEKIEIIKSSIIDDKKYVELNKQNYF